uniref:AlNc14C2G283 protein n=1 Tax=Albugo laibachii Nc14 TaxID=890382 RepID=F0VZE5_9STRA|nr:AlNc14C2G283 [Albugo laibachii Nc14]|eukprot:CCA14175.1 AlNc14C2G283 [Albugo laibachii Nc14]
MWRAHIKKSGLTVAIIPNENRRNSEWTLGATFAKRYHMEMQYITESEMFRFQFKAADDSFSKGASGIYDQHLREFKYETSGWSVLRKSLCCVLDIAKCLIEGVCPSKIDEKTTSKPIVSSKSITITPSEKETKTRCHEDLILNKELFVAILKADPLPKRTLTFKSEESGGPRIYTTQLHYMNMDHFSGYDVPAENHYFGFGPIDAKFKYRGLALRRNLLRHRVRFDFGRLVTEVPPLVYRALVKASPPWPSCMMSEPSSWGMIKFTLKPFPKEFFLQVKSTWWKKPTKRLEVGAPWRSYRTKMGNIMNGHSALHLPSVILWKYTTHRNRKRLSFGSMKWTKQRIAI